MSARNSESRKRAEALMPFGVTDAAAQEALSRQERSREVLRDALAEVWSGASFVDADAVLDQLADRGASVVLS